MLVQKTENKTTIIDLFGHHEIMRWLHQMIPEPAHLFVRMLQGSQEVVCFTSHYTVLQLVCNLDQLPGNVPHSGVWDWNH